MAIVECTIRRPKGTLVTFNGGAEYEFLPSGPEGRHLATVDDPVHLGVFLGITEAYREVAPEAELIKPKPARARPPKP